MNARRAMECMSLLVLLSFFGSEVTAEDSGELAWRSLREFLPDSGQVGAPDSDLAKRLFTERVFAASASTGALKVGVLSHLFEKKPSAYRAKSVVWLSGGGNPGSLGFLVAEEVEGAQFLAVPVAVDAEGRIRFDVGIVGVAMP